MAQRHALGGRPRADQMQTTLPLPLAATHALPIDGNHLLTLHLKRLLHPPNKALLKHPRIQQAEHAPERVVRGDPVR